MTTLERQVEDAVFERVQLGATLSRTWAALRRAAGDRQSTRELQRHFELLVQLDDEMTERHLSTLGVNIPRWRATLQVSDDVLRAALELMQVPAHPIAFSQLRYQLERRAGFESETHWTRGPHLHFRVTATTGVVLEFEVSHGWIVTVSKVSDKETCP